MTFAVTETLATGEMNVEVSAVTIAAGGQENTVADVDKLDFTNRYNAGQIERTTNILKMMSGRPFIDGDSFICLMLSSLQRELDGQTPMSYDDLPQPDGAEAGGTLCCNEER